MFYAIALLCVAILLILMEIVLPSGGILGIVATLCLLGSFVLAFQRSVGVGMLFVVLALLAIPVAVGMGLHYFPRTALGRKMVLSSDPAGPATPAADMNIVEQSLDDLVGKTGRAVTALRPSGIAEFEGQRLSVVSEGIMVAQGTTLQVDRIEGNNIIVIPV